MNLKNKIITIINLCLLIIIIQSSSLLAQNHPDDIYWDRGFGLPGLASAGNSVYDMITFNGELISCGLFYDGLNLLETQNIISWDGTEYKSLDTGISFHGYTMTIYRNNLIVGGYQNDDISIAEWDGSSWSTLDTGLTGNIEDMVVMNDSLFVAGWFKSDLNNYEWYVAVWDGNVWGRLDGTMNGKINTLAVYNNQLIAGGNFTSINLITVYSIAKWNGTTWENFSGNIGTNITEIDVIDSNLVVVGDLIAGRKVATWNNSSSWTFLPQNNDINDIHELIIYNNRITISTSYIDTLTTGAVFYYWDDTIWLPLGNNLLGHAISLAVMGDSLFASSAIKLKGQKYWWFCAKFDTNEWSIVSENGLQDRAYESVLFKDKLIVGGEFHQAGNSDAHQLGAFDGLNWSGYGTSDAKNMPALYSHNDSLYVGGWFSEIAGINSNSAAMFDGTTWTDIGFDTICQPQDFIYYNDKLIAGGGYLVTNSLSDTVTLAYRENNHWVSFVDQPKGGVSQFTIYKNNLIVAGTFDSIGTTPAKNIAMWDGNTWTALATSMQPNYIYISELKIINDTLVISGSFDEIDGVTATGLAFWDGSNWSSIGSGELIKQSEAIISIIEFNNQLIIGGYFDSIGGVAANNIAIWDGATFSPLGSGIEDDTTYKSWDPSKSVYELQVFQNELYTLGNFYKAGGKKSANIARWTKGIPTDITDDEIQYLLPNEYILQQNYPNPFNPTTEISFTLPKKGIVRIDIFNILGQKVSTLVDGYKPVGTHTVTWDATDFASGIYFYKLTTDEFVTEKKMVLVK